MVCDPAKNTLVEKKRRLEKVQAKLLFFFAVKQHEFNVSTRQQKKKKKKKKTVNFTHNKTKFLNFQDKLEV